VAPPIAGGQDPSPLHRGESPVANAMTESNRKLDLRNLHFVGEEGHLIPLLQQAQLEDGYISRQRMEAIHRACGLPLAHIYGVATFYAQFRMQPVGQHIVRVCHGTACHVQGANDITKALQDVLEIASGETTPDRLFTLETVSCLGCCSLAPAVMIGKTTFGKLDPREVKKIIKRFRSSKGGPA
jgi:NADH-quinone oxidoreductase subunit E